MVMVWGRNHGVVGYDNEDELWHDIIIDDYHEIIHE